MLNKIKATITINYEACPEEIGKKRIRVVRDRLNAIFDRESPSVAGDWFVEMNIDVRVEEG